jgi:hypothetical protein
MAARHWTPEQRVQQSAKIRQWQPWNNSTGAKTTEGKAIASRNAYKGGTRDLLRDMAKLLREQKDCLKLIN